MVFLGVVFTLSLFIIAKTLNLYLTSLVLQYFIGVSVIIFVVIFQNEIRKYFELLGLAGTRRIKMTAFTNVLPSTAETIQACVKMARSKTGALIIIQGIDDLEPYMEGGIVLDGMISEEAILSIFDPTSEGHDGAMIIRNNRIYKFGVHLPLSTNFKELGKHGTRHSAALGISEVSDALAIAVSEEKGTISLCREAKMRTLTEYALLEKELDKYIKLKFAKLQDGVFKKTFMHNIALKALAVGVSCLIWFIYVYQTGMVEQSYTVPISFLNLPKDTVIESYKPENFTVVLKGRGDKMLSRVSESDLKVEVDVSDIQNGVNKKSISDTNIAIPVGTTVSSIEPESYLLTAINYFTALVPVEVKTTGTLQTGLELKAIATTTEKVALSIPSGTTQPLTIVTEEIDLTDKTGSVIVPARLVIPNDLKLVKGDGVVEVALTIDKI
jgi:uncharacterized protein (TIGR00159 family)